MEALDAAFARSARRRDESVLAPVIVNSVDDIRRLLAEFDPSKTASISNIELSTLLSGTDENGKATTYKVTAPTKSKTKRDLLIEGLSIVKSRAETADKLVEAVLPTEINGKEVRPPRVITVDSVGWVDRLIKQWLGGHRNGALICWDLPDGYQYQYDIFGHRLSRIQIGSTTSPIS